MGEAKTLSLGSTSDLMVKCGWLDGLIPADEPTLPRTRLAITFGALFQLRKRAREAFEPAFADPIERLEQIHSFRLAAEEDGLRLAVTYDFGWESYMRALWAEAGPFLDLLCCHCEGYRLARETPLDEWQKWIREKQVQSNYFYSATALTVGDLAALSQGERLQRDEADLARADRCLAGLCSLSAVELAEAKRLNAEHDARAQGISVIIAMYRLSRYWTADVESSVIPHDAITLIRATRALIEDNFLQPGSLGAHLEKAYRTQLEWYRQTLTAPTQVASADEFKNAADVQRGIVSGFDRDGVTITHGAALFLAVTDRDKARQSLADLELASEAGEIPGDGLFRNLAFTHPGLSRIGVAPASLRAAPPAFREGAAARAGSVGDVRSFHPANWKPLRRNWDPGPEWEVDLAQVDALVQLRVCRPGAPTDIANPAHPLRAEISRIAALPGLALLAVEGLAPAVAPGSDVDHLGFRDGLSQPTLKGPDSRPWSDRVSPSALLVGRDSEAPDPFWRDGSFLAVRRMTIDRTRFDALLAADSQPGLKDPALLAGKLLGRRRDGRRLGTGRTGNNFVFDGDEAGAICPLDSHIRRANPRRPDTPRIMRRGMSFGPPANGEADGIERGSFFIAYCADLAEQYERILAWVNGGNSTRTGSYLADPLTGVPEHQARTYRFLHEGEVQRLSLPDLKNGVIGLSWSLYLFAPSLPAIRALRDPVPNAADPTDQLVVLGRALIAGLQEKGADAEAWRAVLNEPVGRDEGGARAIWAAIRADGGILDTPAGYLVGDYDLVLAVLRDRGQRFSNRGAGARMDQTIGPFHLGLDPDMPAYKQLSEPANSALRSVKEDSAFALARAMTKGRIAAMLAAAKDIGEAEAAIDLLTNLIEPLLADLAKAWFDIPDGTHVEAEPRDWRVAGRAPRYPGDFWSPSRHAFNPFHSRETERTAIAHGKAAVAAVTRFIESVTRAGLRAPVSSQIAAGTTSYPEIEDLARAMVGCMIGGVPTVAGNAVRLLVEGLESGDLDRSQLPWLRKPDADRTHALASKTFGPAIAELLARAPVPEVLWRVVVGDDVHLGLQKLEKGKILIFSLESAGRDRLGSGVVDNYIPYGMAPPGEAPTPHGCPGREMANGTMLGLLVGLLESARFRPGPARGMAALRPLA